MTSLFEITRQKFIFKFYFQHNFFFEILHCVNFKQYNFLIEYIVMEMVIRTEFHFIRMHINQ